MRTGQPTILLDDDDPQIVRAHLPALEVNGLNVTVATCGKSAMLQAESNSWHAAVVDVGLPDMSGMHVVDYLAGQRSTPVIIISAQQLQSPQKAERGAAVHFLHKPFRTPQLLDRLRQVLADASHF
jgi:two-component system KDP operon response regulator KdpE